MALGPRPTLYTVNLLSGFVAHRSIYNKYVLCPWVGHVELNPPSWWRITRQVTTFPASEDRTIPVL